jgi:hypothetical protein
LVSVFHMTSFSTFAFPDLRSFMTALTYSTAFLTSPVLRTISATLACVSLASSLQSPLTASKPTMSILPSAVRPTYLFLASVKKTLL